MKSNAKCYDELKEYIDSIPLIDCHDHTDICFPKYEDPIQVIISGYFLSDIISASSEKDAEFLQKYDIPLEQRWPVFEKAWKRTCHTGYAQVAKRVLKKFYGISSVNLESLKQMQDKLLDLQDEKLFTSILDEAKIVARLENVHLDLKTVCDGSAKLSPRARLVISLPEFHNITTYEEILKFGLVVDRTITNLDEYLAVCLQIFQAYKQFGAVAFKDQAAYTRTIEYGNPTRTEAEKVFNWIVADPRRKAAYPDGNRPLDDFLFHEFMRMARDLDLPVQLHTGHMAGVRDDIEKTNAIKLRSVLELHRDVRFDLFHANWPYSGELLFLAKNYPNVTIDFCWANIIDPIYCQRMFEQVLSCVPHGKIHAYGSDFGGCVDRAWAHASIARENITIALSKMVDEEYIDVDDAKQIAYAWLFANANEFFRLDIKL